MKINQDHTIRTHSWRTKHDVSPTTITASEDRRARECSGNTHGRKPRQYAAALCMGGILALSGCAVQPLYRAPALKTPSHWQATLPDTGNLQQLQGWWGRFNDPVVAKLIQLAEADSPSLAKAVASIDNARANQISSGSAAWPSLSGTASLTRTSQMQVAGDAPVTSGLSAIRTGGLGASWEIDLFGKLRAGRESAAAGFQASVADWRGAQVSLAAEVADDYVQYRACRLLAKAYEDQAASEAVTLGLRQISACVLAS